MAAVKYSKIPNLVISVKLQKSWKIQFYGQNWWKTDKLPAEAFVSTEKLVAP